MDCRCLVPGAVRRPLWEPGSRPTCDPPRSRRCRIADRGRIVPLGLIVAELVANAAKHGAGAIKVCLEHSPAGGYALSVSDQGVGLPVGVRSRRDQRLRYAGDFCPGRDNFTDGWSSAQVAADAGPKSPSCSLPKGRQVSSRHRSRGRLLRLAWTTWIAPEWNWSGTNVCRTGLRRRDYACTGSGHPTICT